MPRTKTITKTVFTLPELKGNAREEALSKLAEWATSDSFWYESVIDDAKEIGALMGITIKDIYFSGFSSQGDGACFTGGYHYRKGAAKLVREHAPQDTELHQIVDALQKIQSRNFYRISANISQVGRYFNMEIDTNDVTVAEDDGNDGTLADALRDYASWIYRALEKEYEYRTSEEALLEDAEANGYEFTEDGRIA